MHAADERHNSKALSKLASAFLYIEKFEEALFWLNKIDSHGWETVKTLVWKGQAQERLGRFSDAIETYSRVVERDPTHVSCTLRYCDLLWKDVPNDVPNILKRLCESIDETSPDALRAFEYWAIYSERHERLNRGLSPVHTDNLDDLYFTYATEQRDQLVNAARRRLSVNEKDTDALTTLALFDLSQDDWSALEPRVRKLKSIAPDRNDLNFYIDDAAGSHLEGLSAVNFEALLPPVINSIELSPSPKGTIFLSSDPRYFYQFTAPLLLSLESLATPSRVQIHIMDGEHLDAPKTEQFLSGLNHVQCGLSIERSNLGDIPTKQKAIYFHAIRYVRLFQALKSGKGPYCITDVDGLFVKDPQHVFSGLNGQDVGLCPVPGMWGTRSHFQASFTAISNTKDGVNFAKLIAAYVAVALRQDALYWGIDQNALFNVYKYLIRKNRTPKIKVIDETLFSLEAKEDSVFWSDAGKEKFELIRRVNNQDPTLMPEKLDAYSSIYVPHLRTAMSAFGS